MQDASLQESMGPIVRPHEGEPRRLDNGIIMTRHKPDAGRQGAAREGRSCRRRARSEQQAVRSTALLLKRDVHFKDGAKEALKAKKGVPQTTV